MAAGEARRGGGAPGERAAPAAGDVPTPPSPPHPPPAPCGRLAPQGPGAFLSQGPAAKSGAGRAARPACLGGRCRKLRPPRDQGWGAVTFAADPPALRGSGGDSACQWCPGVSSRKWVPQIPA